MSTPEVREPRLLEAALFGEPSSASPSVDTPELIACMLQAGSGISDLIFSPGRPPQVEQHGELTPVAVERLSMLTIDDTCRIARDVIAGNAHALRTLTESGACDVSYTIPNLARFRVNVFKQRGTYAVVMRVIASKIPSFEDLRLPGTLADVATLKNGLVLVTGQTGSGKSSTLAAARPVPASRRRSPRSSI
jgi:twitching motility protein PilT